MNNRLSAWTLAQRCMMDALHSFVLRPMPPKNDRTHLISAPVFMADGFGVGCQAMATIKSLGKVKFFGQASFVLMVLPIA